MTGEYEISLTNGVTLTTIHPLEVNGPGNLSTPRQIQQAKPSLAIGAVSTVSPNGVFYLEGDQSDYFSIGLGFVIEGSTSNDGSYVVANLPVPGSTPTTNGVWYNSGTNRTYVIVTTSIPSAVGAMGQVVLNMIVLNGLLSYRFVPSFNFSIQDSGSIDGTYTVDTIGSWEANNTTYIPVNSPIPAVTLPLGSVVYSVVADTQTSLSLPGRGVLNYGELIIDNFVHHLENFANSSPPLNPLVGQLWYDTSSSELKTCTSNGSPALWDVVATQEYVDTEIATHANDTTLHLSVDQNTFLDNFESAGTITGSISSDLHAMTGYTSNAGSVYTNIDSRVLRSGDTMTGFLELHADPTNPMHAATKQYVDSIASSVVTTWKAPVKVLDQTIYVDASTFPITGIVDGVSLNVGDRVLFSNVGSGSPFVTTIESGVWIWTGGSPEWVMDSSPRETGDVVYVIDGTSAGVVVAFDVNDTWTQISGSGATWARGTYTIPPGSPIPTTIVVPVTYDDPEYLLVFLNGQKTILNEDFVQSVTPNAIDWTGIPLVSGDVFEFYAGISSFAPTPVSTPVSTPGAKIDELIADGSGTQSIFAPTNVSVQNKTATTAFQQVFVNGLLQKEGSAYTVISFGSPPVDVIQFNPGSEPPANADVTIYAL